LPGYGHEKAQIFIALLGKRFGVRPKGWKEAAGEFSDSEYRTVADITSEATLIKVRETKKMQKAAELDKRGTPKPIKGSEANFTSQGTCLDAKEEVVTTLVTGGAGYIGSITTRMLSATGRKVVVLDSLENGHAEAVTTAPLVVGNIADSSLV